MENEIKVGEYCRTKDGYISQVTEIDHYIWFNSIIYKESGIGCYELSRVEFKNLVVKHSPNLIDIIEKRRLCKWNISNRKRKHIIMDRNKRNR